MGLYEQVMGTEEPYWRMKEPKSFLLQEARRSLNQGEFDTALEFLNRHYSANPEGTPLAETDYVIDTAWRCYAGKLRRIIKSSNGSVSKDTIDDLLGHISFGGDSEEIRNLVGHSLFSMLEDYLLKSSE